MSEINRYEIQCPNCGNALILPADNDEELKEYFRITKGTFKQCPACLHTFEGLLEKENHNVSWNMIIDKNGSRFNKWKEDLDVLLEYDKEHKYLVRERDHCHCPECLATQQPEEQGE